MAGVRVWGCRSFKGWAEEARLNLRVDTEFLEGGMSMAESGLKGAHRGHDPTRIIGGARSHHARKASRTDQPGCKFWQGKRTNGYKTAVILAAFWMDRCSKFSNFSHPQIDQSDARSPFVISTNRKIPKLTMMIGRRIGPL